jgi:cytochrome c oxidase subunit 2
MSWQQKLLPWEASVGAAKTDMIFIFLFVFAVLIVVLVLSLMVGFSIRYRRGSAASREKMPEAISREWEIGWTSATFFIAIFIFWWAGSTQLRFWEIPKNALEIHVIGKQWMWKIQHPSGASEIDTLHAPAGVPVKLVVTSRDVVHSFYIPAFRLKRDAVPGRYNEAWFQATRPGKYDLLCSEFCGLDHSEMRGQVIIMSPADYVKWANAQPQGDSLAVQGREKFVALGCAGCHSVGSQVRAPKLEGLYGQPVPLSDGRVVTADEAYLRDSILLPRKDVVASFDPVMPSYQGAATEEDINALVAYIKSIGPSGKSS